MLDADIDDSPLEYGLKTTSFPSISDEMVSTMALGLEDDLVVAARHGLSVEQFLELAQQPFFQTAVANKRSEFEKNGVTFKAKAAWMAGELLDKVYLAAANSDTSLAQRHDVLKTLIKAAGLEPKEDRAANLGPGFSISIDLGDRSVRISNDDVIDAPTKEIT